VQQSKGMRDTWLSEMITKHQRIMHVWC